jgi:hypothetical protein
MMFAELIHQSPFQLETTMLEWNFFIHAPIQQTTTKH